MDNEDLEKETSPSVPTELMELHVQLEKAGVTPKQFKEAYGNEAR